MTEALAQGDGERAEREMAEQIRSARMFVIEALTSSPSIQSYKQLDSFDMLAERFGENRQHGARSRFVGPVKEEEADLAGRSKRFLDLRPVRLHWAAPVRDA